MDALEEIVLKARLEVAIAALHRIADSSFAARPDVFCRATDVEQLAHVAIVSSTDASHTLNQIFQIRIEY